MNNKNLIEPDRTARLLSTTLNILNSVVKTKRNFDRLFEIDPDLAIRQAQASVKELEAEIEKVQDEARGSIDNGLIL